MAVHRQELALWVYKILQDLFFSPAPIILGTLFSNLLVTTVKHCYTSQNQHCHSEQLCQGHPWFLLSLRPKAAILLDP
jgi:hypothetical protein